MFVMPKPVQPTHPRIKLNLLFPSGSSTKLAAKFLRWLISYGRFIVIVVEMVVVGCFIWRFSLDAKLDDLKKNIKKEVPFVTGLAADEALIRLTQTKLANIKQNYSTNDTFIQIIDKIASKTPSKITFNSLRVEYPETSKTIQFNISAQAVSSTDLSIFLANLRAENTFKDVTLANINLDRGQILFVITGGVK